MSRRAMSTLNLELVRGVIAAHERGDFASVFAAYDPGIEWSIARTPALRMAGPGGLDLESVYHGHDGVRAFWRAWFAAWEHVSFEYVWTVKDGKIVRVEFFLTRSEALRAVGVSASD